MMETKCPHCGSAYEVDESASGEKVQCPNCRKDFTVGKTIHTGKTFTVKKGFTAAKRGAMWRKHSPAGNLDVHYISPAIAKFLELLDYLFIAAATICLIFYCIYIAVSQYEPIFYLIAFLALIVAVFAALLVRLLYELIVVKFEINRNLRQIRDRLNPSEGERNAK